LPLVTIGVDSSGKWGDPPIWIVASRHSKTKGQICCTAYLSNEKYQSVKGSCKNWKDKFRAILVFKVVSIVIYDRDIIIIHVDFHGKTREHVVSYLKKLFREVYPRRFPKKPLKTEPDILFSNTKHSVEVKIADRKSKNLRLGVMPENIIAHIKDPSFDLEINSL